MTYSKAARRVRDKARRDAGLDQRDRVDQRCCWRCGVDFDGQFHYVADAPCVDCREFLRKEDGDTTKWRGSPQIRVRESTMARAA
ncbi:MAG: hypothetical protein JWN41_1740 [Thermoleophilia bacterium]|nr:hypothetical protein [Thermoleophilia bacterium]